MGSGAIKELEFVFKSTGRPSLVSSVWYDLNSDHNAQSHERSPGTREVRQVTDNPKTKDLHSPDTRTGHLGYLGTARPVETRGTLRIPAFLRT